MRWRKKKERYKVEAQKAKWKSHLLFLNKKWHECEITLEEIFLNNFFAPNLFHAASSYLIPGKWWKKSFHANFDDKKKNNFFVRKMELWLISCCAWFWFEFVVKVDFDVNLMKICWWMFWGNLEFSFEKASRMIFYALKLCRTIHEILNDKKWYFWIANWDITDI